MAQIGKLCQCVDHRRHCLPWAQRRPEPGGLPRQARGGPRSSERNLIVVVDQLGVFLLGRFRAVEKVDLLGDDLAAVAVVTHAVGPLGLVDAAVNEDLHAVTIRKIKKTHLRHRGIPTAGSLFHHTAVRGAGQFIEVPLKGCRKTRT